MTLARFALGGLAVLALSACNKTDTAPRPEHSDVATSMPDAASTPGAVGPGATAPHETPPPDAKLPQPAPSGAGPAPQANPADHPN
jgi:hypothetical protein